MDLGPAFIPSLPPSCHNGDCERWRGSITNTHVCILGPPHWKALTNIHWSNLTSCLFSTRTPAEQKGSFAFNRSNQKQTALSSRLHKLQQAQACLLLLLSTLICWTTLKHMMTAPTYTQIPDPKNSVLIDLLRSFKEQFFKLSES